MKKTLVAATLICLSMTACVPAVLFGGAAVGAYTASDRRTVAQQIEDKKLDSLVERRIEENFGEKLHVNATVFNGVLLLTGEVPTAQLRQSLNELLKLTPNVKRVIDETRQIPVSATQWQINDAAMTTKVKTRLANSNAFHIAHIKVITEGNDVFLMGRVTQSEADAAIEIARTTTGVNRVVNAFEIMSEDEWKKEQEEAARAKAQQPAAAGPKS